MKKELIILGMLFPSIALCSCTGTTYESVDENGSTVKVTTNYNVAHICLNDTGAIDIRIKEWSTNATDGAYTLTLEDGRKMKAGKDSCVLFMDKCEFDIKQHFSQKYYIGTQTYL